MRIVSGRYKGIRINPPNNLPVRPTTDLSKEALFNILVNHFDLSSVKVLDLFAGTGNISYEFASRGAEDITAVDLNYRCIAFIKETAARLEMQGLKIIKASVFKFLETCREQFDIIFADPPYDMPDISTIPNLVFEKGLLAGEGWLIIEHSSLIRLEHLPYYRESRKYGQSTFSIFSAK
jgi:16S rRNA (guanine966-N2)-methyltransferase